MHGVALHSLALCNFAESVRWHEKVPLSIVVAVPRVGGLGTKIFHAVSGGALIMRACSASGGSVGDRTSQAAAGSLSHWCIGFRLWVHRPWRCGRDPVPFCSTFEVPRSTSGWGQHFVLVRALLGSADRMVGGQVYAP